MRHISVARVALDAVSHLLFMHPSSLVAAAFALRCRAKHPELPGGRRSRPAALAEAYPSCADRACPS